MTMTGLGYNSVTKTFDLLAKKWEEYLQVVFFMDLSEF